MAKEVDAVLNKGSDITSRFRSVQKAARLAVLLQNLHSGTKSTQKSKEAEETVVAKPISEHKRVKVWQGAYYKKWRVAIASTLLGIRMAMQYREIAMRTQAYTSLPGKETGVLTYLLKIHKSQADSNLSQKIFKLLESEERTKETIETIERMLLYRVRSFSKFSLAQRLKFCELMQL
eukprot:jgi/Hompol1/298/HPOL_000895-RA